MSRRRRDLGFDGEWYERSHWWRSLLLKLALCLGVTALLWFFQGWSGGLVSVMLWARVFAVEFVNLGEWLLRALKGRAMAPVQGRFYAFKGQRIEVIEGDAGPARWLAVADLAAALEEPITERALALRFAAGLRREGRRLFLRDDEALAYLAQRRAERATPLRRWVEQEVWQPARGRRANYPPPTSPPPP